MAMILCFNPVLKAATQWHGLPFNSFAVVDGKTLAAGPDGIHQMGGETDDGAAINAYFKLPTVDLGSVERKHLRWLYMGWETTGAMYARLVFDERHEANHEIAMPYGDGSQSGASVCVSARNRGRYFSLEIGNRDGADFGVDAVDALVIATRA